MEFAKRISTEISPGNANSVGVIIGSGVPGRLRQVSGPVPQGGGPHLISTDAELARDSAAQGRHPFPRPARQVWTGDAQPVIAASLCQDSQVMTRRGIVAAGDLHVGDKVLTRDSGTKRLTWIGRQDVSAALLASTPQLAPVSIAANSLAWGLPNRDLILSPDHRLLITDPRADLLFGEHEVFVAARFLLDRPGVERLRTTPTTYIQLMFDQHEIINVDGCWVESYQPATANLPPEGDPQRDRLLALYPDLGRGEIWPAARKTLKRHEANLLQHA